mgnify:CR=1 FL=1
MTQINYNKISIGPVKLGPSIQEGELGVHSLLSSGPHPAEPIFRTAPILLSAPRIGGNNIIPNTLSVVSFGVYQEFYAPVAVLIHVWFGIGVSAFLSGLELLLKRSCYAVRPLCPEGHLPPLGEG